MGYYSSKIKANALDSSAKGKKKDMGELVNGDEMYEVLKEEEEDYTPPPSSDESDDKDDLFNENLKKKQRVINKAEDFLIDEEERNKMDELQKLRKQPTNKVLESEKGNAEANFDQFMMQDVSEPEIEPQVIRPKSSRSVKPIDDQNDAKFDLGNVPISKSEVRFAEDVPEVS
jgi:hypothetical protein